MVIRAGGAVRFPQRSGAHCWDVRRTVSVAERVPLPEARSRGAASAHASSGWGGRRPAVGGRTSR